MAQRIVERALCTPAQHTMGRAVSNRRDPGADRVCAPYALSACVAAEQAPHFEGAHAWVGTVEIGEPERTYTVEPLEDPVPRERPAEPAEQPAGPSPAEEPIEPERVRAP
jgi:hypothetical protein